MLNDMNRLLTNLNGCNPATRDALNKCEKQLGIKFPPEYVEILKTANGGEGFIGKNAYVILWGVEELPSMNQAYEVQEYVSGLLIFGSNGGGEAYGFDTRTQQWQIVQVPFVGMAWDLAQPIGRTFDAFLGRLYEIETSRQEKSGDLDCQGKEIVEIKPIILGGSPTDRANKTVLSRQDHIKFVVYWNKVIKELR